MNGKKPYRPHSSQRQLIFARLRADRARPFMAMALLTALLTSHYTAVPADPLSVTQLSPAPHDNAAPGPAERDLTFHDMGAYKVIPLRGVDASDTLKFGTRLDEIVDSAKLVLNYTYSPALNFDQSHLKVIVNDEVIDTIPFSRAQAGKPVTSEVAIDPRYLTAFNTLTVEFIAHYANAGCEDRQNSTLWAEISPTSSVHLTEHSVVLPDDLALLPAPFFDRRDNGRLLLPFVFAGTPSLAVQHAAGVLASWFGAQASYRGTRFPVSINALPDRHAVVFAVNGEQPGGLQLPQVNGPTVMEMPRPGQPLDKLLLVLGRNAQDLETAVDALALGRQTLAGNRALLRAVDLGPRRKPYDAPNWVTTDKPVKLGDLLTAPDTLQTAGLEPAPLDIRVHVPADLWPWQSVGIPVDLKYRYTPPADGDSLLNIDLNGQFAQSIRLKPVSDGLLQKALPGWITPAAGGQTDVSLPVSAMTSNNQLEFQFRHEPQKTSSCHSMVNEAVKASIDPESTIDLSGFPHYAKMPNVGFFANSGFPFTKYADLSHTALVVPDQPTPMDLETELTLLGHMGAWTGYAALRYALVTPANVKQVEDRDLLLVGSGSVASLMRQWGAAVPLRIDPGQRHFALASADTGLGHWVDAALHSEAEAQTDPLHDDTTAALVGFASPYGAPRSIVALTATSDAGLGAVLDALDDQGTVANIQGGVTLIRDRGVQSFEAGSPYYIGHIPPLTRARFFLASYPLLIVLLGMAAVVISSILGYGFLKRRAAKRLKNESQ